MQNCLIQLACWPYGRLSKSESFMTISTIDMEHTTSGLHRRPRLFRPLPHDPHPVLGEGSPPNTKNRMASRNTSATDAGKPMLF